MLPNAQSQNAPYNCREGPNVHDVPIPSRMAAIAMAGGRTRHLKNLARRHRRRSLDGWLGGRHYVNATADIDVSAPLEDLTLTPLPHPPPFPALSPEQTSNRSQAADPRTASSHAVDSRASETNFLRTACSVLEQHDTATAPGSRRQSQPQTPHARLDAEPVLPNLDVATKDDEFLVKCLLVKTSRYTVTA